ncbi:YSIRK-type signal peptide-containing protein [Staphylococcus carnosus]|nr:YSIRK-type signal peptide-containing protein [Staphylococcus carnosus]
MRCINLEKRENKYSIRKFAIGTSSILVASLFFIGSGGADAAEASPEKTIRCCTSSRVCRHNAIT